MSDPLISVVIPVWNEEKRVVRAVNSMRNQTYKNLEIIVVDDGSTDGTRAAVEAMAKEDSRVQYHHHHDPKEKRKNWRGYDISAGYAARNFGFKIAKGEWLTTQDADDASLLNRIDVQYRMAEKYKATLVTIQWIPLLDNLNKRLDVERFIREKGESNIVIRPEEIIKIAQGTRGPLMMESVHRFIPFPIKWFPHTRKLFFRNVVSYPGADNSMLFHKSVRDAGFYLRHRNERTWGLAAGRGSGRDFVFRVASHFKNSWSFRLPLYLWDVTVQNPDYAGYEKYLI